MLDEIDRRILRVLQTDGRITNQDLAQQVGLSPAACHERFRRLRERGYITGFAALLDPAMMDRALLIFVEIQLDRTTTETFDQFAAAVRRAPEILECHMVAGGFDYLIKARVEDMTAYRAFLGGTLVDLPGVRETRTYAVLEEVKNTVALPVQGRLEGAPGPPKRVRAKKGVRERPSTSSHGCRLFHSMVTIAHARPRTHRFACSHPAPRAWRLRPSHWFRPVASGWNSDWLGNHPGLGAPTGRHERCQRCSRLGRLVSD